MLVALPAMTVKVTVLFSDVTSSLSLKIINGTLMLPHTLVLEQVKVTGWFAGADVRSTTHVGISATARKCSSDKNQNGTVTY